MEKASCIVTLQHQRSGDRPSTNRQRHRVQEREEKGIEMRPYISFALIAPYSGGKPLFFVSVKLSDYQICKLVGKAE